MSLNIIIPLVGIAVAVSVPLTRYGLRHQNERSAIDAVREIQRAQTEFSSRARGYATTVDSLISPCGDGEAPLLRVTLQRLSDAGYTWELRAASGAERLGADCHGRPLASDYYVAIRPASSWSAARQAFAGRSEGHLHFFQDGIPPREADIDGGLAAPVDARDTFKIP